MRNKKLAILGSTGSIGTQALDVVEKHREHFEIVVLTANNNANLLIEQAMMFSPKHVVIGNQSKYNEVKEALQHYSIEVHGGCEAIAEVVTIADIDMVLTAMVGFAGLAPTLKAIEAGKDIALANKETLVVAGELIMRLARQNNCQIHPVDSEHSAIYQCLAGEENNPIEKIFLTASGGPFRTYSYDELLHVTSKQALLHPTWCMGAKITIDSASMMNKGLEAIEAHWLFDVEPNQIEVVVHPQSIVHSLVQFQDGSIKAQLGLPDMRLPIQYAMSFPERLPSDFKRFSFLNHPNLTFESPDVKKFHNLALAFEAMKKGGNIPCAMNAANEVVVEAFLQEKLGFLDMAAITEKVMEQVDFSESADAEVYQQTDKQARKLAGNLIK